jgi:DNA mismatch repair protein MutS
MGVGVESPDTPLMRQYWEIKKQHQDAILLFRLGDFYEMFFGDAEVASKILDIALTSRDKNSENPVPLCGVPHHSVSGYISKLLEEGHKVAICEQVEDPALAKGIVRREVVRVITPGLQTDLEGLPATEANSIVAVWAGAKSVGLASLDVTTGRFTLSDFPGPLAAEDEIWRILPREVVLPEGKPGDFFTPWTVAYSAMRPGARFERVPEWAFENGERKLCERFSVGGLEGFGFPEETESVKAAAALIHYVEKVNRTALPHLQPPAPYSTEGFVHLDRATRENLEIDRVRGEPGHERSLFGCLNETQTSMGARRLREWLLAPLRDVAAIEGRLDAVEELLGAGETRELLRRELTHVYDLERLIGRIASARADARDLSALAVTLGRTVVLKGHLNEFRCALLAEAKAGLDPHEAIRGDLEKALADNPPFGTKEGGMIRDGYHAGLDELRSLMRGGRSWIADLEKREKERTGISSLKVGYNRVFGYYLEVTNTHLSKVPPDYQRKQTLTNAERYVTPELKEQENRILSAEEKSSRLEFELFEGLRKRISASTRSLQRLAFTLADLDVLCSLARTAARHRYCRPRINGGTALRIAAGRHPVVERFMDGEPFVPNDILLNGEERQMVILTGPNMAGKSTIMRQVGLITLMAQTGSFVPADEAEICVVDRIFTRVGASDDVARGRSTFMVEMSEAANILRNATERSLVLLDEIGRGTSTFDGLAIAWAVAEDLHDRVGAKTIFATHYHELTDLTRTKAKVRNMNVSVKEWGEKIVFLHTLNEGAVSRSYGIEVARLAGVPDGVIKRARTILKNLERGELDALGRPVLAGSEEQGKAAQAQLELFRRMGDELLAELSRIQPDELTPKEAMELLFAWRDRFRAS